MSIYQLIQSLQLKLAVLLSFRDAPQGINNREKLYYAAKACLGRDASPNDIAPDEAGCAESVNDVHTYAFGFPIGGDISTYRLYGALVKSRLFAPVTTPLRGDVVISPTGYGNGSIPGHCGIYGDNDIIYSNDSATGLFSTKYSITDWRARYQQRGGIPVYFFRRV